jgi:hypothetical protein
LVGLAPDVILAGGTPGVAALQRITRSLPIVFVGSLIQLAQDWSIP